MSKLSMFCHWQFNAQIKDSYDIFTKLFSLDIWINKRYIKIYILNLVCVPFIWQIIYLCWHLIISLFCVTFSALVTPLFFFNSRKMTFSQNVKTFATQYFKYFSFGLLKCLKQEWPILAFSYFFSPIWRYSTYLTHYDLKSRITQCDFKRCNIILQFPFKDPSLFTQSWATRPIFPSQAQYFSCRYWSHWSPPAVSQDCILMTNQDLAGT